MHKDDAPEASRERALHIRLAPKLHRKMPIAAAEDDVSLQELTRPAPSKVLAARGAGQERT